MRPEAVLFDCDGVIVDSEPITDRVIAASLARHGFEITLAEVSTLFLGGTISGVAETARARGTILPDDWVAQVYSETFTRLAEGTPLVPGIEAVLDRLDVARIPYAVGSNGPHAKMQVTLGQHPALHSRLTGRIFSREDVARPKPAPDLYLHAARSLGVRPENCVVIEDSATGIRSANAAGMTAFGYAHTGDGTLLKAEGARLFRRMCDLPALLGL